MKTYSELKKENQDTFDAFPAGYAFNDKQFSEMMEKFGLEVGDTDKIIRMGGGCFVRKADKKAFDEMFEGIEKKMAEAMEDDEFLIDAIVYELGNHEYCITYDIYPTVDALGIDISDERIKRCLTAGRKRYIIEYEEFLKKQDEEEASIKASM